MDKETKQSFGWLPAQMPRVAAMMKTRRAKDGDAHVNECWRRGVVAGEPGWFFAIEGGLAVGVPAANWDWKKWPELAALPDAVKPALLLLRDKEASDGTQ